MTMEMTSTSTLNFTATPENKTLVNRVNNRNVKVVYNNNFYSSFTTNVLYGCMPPYTILNIIFIIHTCPDEKSICGGSDNFWGCGLLFCRWGFVCSCRCEWINVKSRVIEQIAHVETVSAVSPGQTLGIITNVVQGDSRDAAHDVILWVEIEWK